MEPKKVFSTQLAKLLVLFFGVFIIFAVLYFQKLPDGKLHLIFCDVGQGDGILVKTPQGAQILIDGGPNASILSCLGKHLPFYDRNLELVILTHPQADHLTGLVSVFENYNVEKVLKTAAVNNTTEFAAFIKALSQEKSQEFEAISGTQINFDSKLTAKILWPTQSLATIPINNLNDTSIVLRFDLGNFCAMLTGDAGNSVWFQLLSAGSLNSCFLLKVAHHGSRNGTNTEFLSAVQPKIGVISAGLNNRYNHPHQEVLAMLEERRIEVKRTDKEGSVEIITNGRSVQVR